MDNKTVIGICLVAGAVGFYLWKKFVRPANVNHDSTVLFTGGLGSGKSLSSVKEAVKSIKRSLSSWHKECLKIRFLNWFYSKFRKDYVPSILPEKPLLLSTTPVRWLTFHGWEWSHLLTRRMLLLDDRIPVGSVVFIDEFPQFCNQYDWDNPEVQNQLNEFITFFRHYIGGVFIINAQSLDEVECHVRRKLNSYYYCFDFHRFLCFYRVRLLRCRVGDMSVSLTNDFIEENAKWHYGLLFSWLRNYDSRCYRHRYDSVQPPAEYYQWDKLTTDYVVRLDLKKKSKLDPKL